MCERFLAVKPAGKSALVTLPTGAGKTAVIAAASARASDEAPVLVVSPSDALCDQLVTDIGSRTWQDVDLRKYGPPPRTQRLMPSDGVGRLETKPGERLVLVATMQAVAMAHRTNANLYKTLQESLSVLVVDEGHREPAPTWARALRGLGKPTILLSATPYRNDLRQFNVDSEFVAQLSFASAVEQRILRDVEVEDTLAGANYLAFASALVQRIQSLGDDGLLAPKWKAIVHCETARDIERIHDALSTIKWARDRGILSFHETFAGKGQTKLVEVPLLRDRTERFLIHQYKLMEGIDDSSIQVLCIWEPFKNARSLVQQVGRIVRNPDGSQRKAYLLTRPTDALTSQQWLSFREFDQSLGQSPLTDRDIVVKLLAALPEYDYILGAFRRRVPQDFDRPFDKELLVRRSALIFRHPSRNPRAGLQKVLPGIRESLITADRWIAKELDDGFQRPNAAGHIFLSAIVAPSQILTESAFMELRFAATVVRQVQDYLFISDSEGGSFLDLDDLLEDPISSIDLTPLISGTESRVTGMSAMNSDIGSRALRHRSNSSYNLNESAPYLADHQYVLRRVQGYAGREHRALGLARSRLTASRGEHVSVKEFADWTATVVSELSSARRIARNAYFDRFSQPIPAPDEEEAEPLHILLDVEALIDRFEHPDHPGEELLSDTELASEVTRIGDEDGVPSGATHSFLVTIFGQRHAVFLRYDEKRNRYQLYSEFLNCFVNVSRPKETLLTSLNARQAFRIVPLAQETIYAGRRFYRTELTADPGSRGRLLLDLLYPLPQLEGAMSEKGDIHTAPAGRWSAGSVFDLIDRGLAGGLGSPFIGQRFSLIGCTDLGREIADFVAVDPHGNQLVFLHAKAGDNQFSVSALQEVVAQGIKNLANATVGSSKLVHGLDVLRRAWRHNGRTRERMRAGTFAQFLEQAKAVSTAPNGQREVWLVLGGLLSKSVAEEQFRENSASPAVAQMFMLLSSFYTQCVSSGVALRIFCSP